MSSQACVEKMRVSLGTRERVVISWFCKILFKHYLPGDITTYLHTTFWTKTPGGTWVRLDPSFNNASAAALRSLST
jgi:hypothetical protein